MLTHLTLNKKIVSLLAVFLAGLALETSFIHSMVAQIRVHGPVYQEIAKSKDLIADILPPPEYLIEAYLVVHRQLDAADEAAREPLAEQMTELRTAYEERHRFWSGSLPPGALHDSLLVDSYAAAQRFFSGYDHEFLPALRAGDSAKARLVLRRTLEPAYQEHLRHIQSVVRHASAVVRDKEQEAAQRATSGLRMAGLGMLLLGGAAALACWLVIRSISGPMAKVSELLGAIAARDLTRHVELETDDEFGDMVRVANSAARSMRDVLQSIATQAEALATASEELRVVSEHMSANAEETAAQAHVVTAASEQVSTSVQAMSSSTDGLNASVREIARSTNDASAASTKAVGLAETADRAVSRLGESSAGIGKILRVINAIAEQTNLLALNATIEAARAGEAGKGFAVVANEVKDLAAETGRATQDIARRIEAIRMDTQGAVDAIAEIRSFIGKMSEVQTSIAAAIEEHSATTSQIAHSLGEGVRGTTEISSNISGVAEAARHTSSGASDTKNAASELARMASELRRVLANFAY